MMTLPPASRVRRMIQRSAQMSRSRRRRRPTPRKIPRKMRQAAGLSPSASDQCQIQVLARSGGRGLRIQRQSLGILVLLYLICTCAQEDSEDSPCKNVTNISSRQFTGQARFEAMAEKNEASQKKQEEDVDTSLALLERLNQQNQTPHVARERRGLVA